jgi:hypothetical protein
VRKKVTDNAKNMTTSCAIHHKIKKIGGKSREMLLAPGLLEPGFINIKNSNFEASKN